ncbi:MAG: PilZ domain-containing protein [Nitrospirota bacterium]
MILRLICPRCNKDSYSSSAEIFKPCPYCGILFSGRYGVDKRKQYRAEKEMSVILCCGGQNIRANTMNYSPRGLCIKLLDNAPLAADDVMDLEVDDSKLKAEVVWTKKLDVSSAVAGLKIIDGDLKMAES